MSAEDVTFQAAAAAVKEEEDAKPLEDGELSDDDEPSSAAAAVALEEGEIPAASSSGVENADKSNEKAGGNGGARPLQQINTPQGHQGSRQGGRDGRWAAIPENAFQRFENMLTWERGFEKIAALVASAKNKKAAMTQEELTNYATTWRQAQVKAFDDDAKETEARKAKAAEAGPDDRSARLEERPGSGRRSPERGHRSGDRGGGRQFDRRRRGDSGSPPPRRRRSPESHIRRGGGGSSGGRGGGRRSFSPQRYRSRSPPPRRSRSPRSRSRSPNRRGMDGGGGGGRGSSSGGGGGGGGSMGGHNEPPPRELDPFGRDGGGAAEPNVAALSREEIMRQIKEVELQIAKKKALQRAQRPR
eukprot:gene14407-25209_t